MCFDRRELWRRGSPPEQLGNTLLLFDDIDQINPHLKRMLVSTMPAMNDKIIYRHTVIALIVIGFCCNPLDLKQSSDSPIYRQRQLSESHHPHRHGPDLGSASNVR